MNDSGARTPGPRRGHRTRRVLVALLVVAVLLGGALYYLRPRPPEAPPAPPQVPAVLQPKAHPRILLSSQDIPKLRLEAQTTHSEIWRPILGFAQSRLNSDATTMPAEKDLDGFRNAGNQVIAFAFAYVITGDRGYFDLTRRNLQAYTEWTYWGDENQYGDRDLGFHHMLMGFAIAYDWIYNDLSPADRGTLGATLARRTEESYQAASQDKTEWSNWWRRAYSQNHNWDNNSALGIAALVLDGEDQRASTWLDQAVADIKKASYAADQIADGSWHEGIPYQSYALTMTLPFLESLRTTKGQDITPNKYLQNYPAWRVYNSLPGTYRFALSYADFEWSWANAYGQEGILRFAARQYKDGRAEWVARQLIAATPRVADVYFAPWYVFEFLYYDPTVTPQPPDGLPLSRAFPDLGAVIWRNGWGQNDLVFGFKAGAPGGRFFFDAFPNSKKYPYDPASDVDMLHTGHDHDDDGSFYLYVGNADLSSERVGYQLTQTEYHNSLLVDGKGQYQPDNAGDSTDPAQFVGTDARITAAADSPGFNYVAADLTNRYRTDGSSPPRPGPRTLDEFTRYVLFARPDYLVVFDNVTASSPHLYDWVSHFGTSVSVNGGWLMGAARGGNVLGVYVVEPAEFNSDTGNDGKPYVRIRPASGQAANTRFVTVLFPTTPAKWDQRPQVALLGDEGSALGLRVSLNGSQDHLLRYAGTGVVAVGGYSFDAMTATAEKDASLNLRRLFLGQGTQLSDTSGTRLLLQTSAKATALEVDYSGQALAISGDGLSGARIYAPGVDAGQVTVNGKATPATRDGDYVVLP